MVHPYSGTLSNNIKEQLLIHATAWINIKGIMLNKKNKKPISRCYILYDYRAFSRDKFIVKKRSEVPKSDSGGRCEDKDVV